MRLRSIACGRNRHCFGIVVIAAESAASAAEVLEAFTWANSDDQIGTDLERGPRGAVTRVYEILKMEEPEPDERR